ncbi:hypothetical protein GCM10010462_13180 [Microbacterium dextranolyticum]|uniref:Uncharacterized protein n=1 Tax=Microbacterium dextranolyticum TaxID=36806 RepID=A0A9W6M4U5_9MICO|nr:hypothetical protein GCM10017591_00060 [Microbacterium dextranolyticum]
MAANPWFEFSAKWRIPTPGARPRTGGRKAVLLQGPARWSVRRAAERRNRNRSINAMVEAVKNLSKTEPTRQRGPWRTVEQVGLAPLELGLVVE